MAEENNRVWQALFFKVVNPQCNYSEFIEFMTAENLG